MFLFCAVVGYTQKLQTQKIICDSSVFACWLTLVAAPHRWLSPSGVISLWSEVLSLMGVLSQVCWQWTRLILVVQECLCFVFMSEEVKFCWV